MYLPSQVKKSVATILFHIFKFFIFFAVRAVFAAHAVGHVFGPFYDWLKRLWIPAKNIAEIDM